MGNPPRTTLTQRSFDTVTYVYNGDDELTSQSSVLNGTTTLTYDANGSQLTSTNGSNVTTYCYEDLTEGDRI